jgi:acetyl-CoA carboxylase carboxyl transferase subunit beta
MAWWSRDKEKKTGAEARSEKRSVPSGLFRKCDSCGATLETEQVKAALWCCPRCDHHFTMPTPARIELLCDEGSWIEQDGDVRPVDRLGFSDGKRYAERLLATQKKTGIIDAFRSGSATLDGKKIQLGVFAFEFMGGSMGSVVGEKIARLFERAEAQRCAAVLCIASGGARMQEGILSLMQMAKTTAALARLKAAGLPYFAVLLHPTTGGVAASFAMLGDVILAEPEALIGFAGPRVIEQTIRQRLPAGFQRSEFLLEHGMVDVIVSRKHLRAKLSILIGHLTPPA